MTAYIGFSTYNRYRKFTLTDFDLVRQDLFNHFSIRKGEKLMNPKFGTIIWSLLFEPMVEEVRDLIVDDIKSVVNYDPRIAVENIIVTEYDRGIQVELELTFILTNQSAALVMQFDKDARSLTIS